MPIDRERMIYDRVVRIERGIAWLIGQRLVPQPTLATMNTKRGPELMIVLPSDAEREEFARKIMDGEVKP